MTAPTTAEEWGRLAVSLPGWRWMPGMRQIGDGRGYAMRLDVTGFRGVGPWHGFHGHSGDERSPCDPDDPATAGCLLALLGGHAIDVVCPAANEGRWAVSVSGPHHIGIGITLGRAAIAAAAAIGRWPGGDP